MLKNTPRTTGSSGTPDNLPPLTFHSVHGENVRVFNDGSFASVVRGSDGYPGIAFSARPVQVNENVCLRIVTTEFSWSGLLFFGFTSHDPATLAHPLPITLRCINNRSSGGNWAKEKLFDEDNIFDYYVDSAGDVHFSIDGADRGLFLAGVDTENPLWAFVLLNFGATVQFLDPRPRTPNQVRRQSQSPVDEDRLKAPRTTGTGGTPDNLPPLTFHSVHGTEVRVSSDGSIASRVRGYYGNSIAFSARPVRVNEKVCLRFVGAKSVLKITLFFGFTSHDPATLAHSLPVSAYDFINKPSNWAYIKNFNEDCIFDYYVNSAGDVHFSINGEDERLLFSGVYTKNPLWAFVDVSWITAFQFVAPRAPNQVRRQNQSPVDGDRLEASLSSLCVNEPLPPLRYTNPLVPLSLHRTKGRNLQFVNDRGVAARVDEEIGQGYVFTAQPMRLGQTIVVQIVSTESGRDAGILSIGLTSCDPARLKPCDLPADAELLLDRSEYWVVQRDPANGLGRGDELAVTLTMDGEVRVSRNGSTPVTVMHVDHTVELWAFFDICGATQKVRMLTTEAVPSSPQQSRVLTGTAAPLVGGIEKEKWVVQSMTMLAARAGVTDVVFAERVVAPAEAGGRPRRVVVRLARRHLRHELKHPARVRRTVTDATGGRVYNKRLTRHNRQLFHQVREESPRTTGTGGTPDNLPPLTFHSVHGKNVRVSGSIASRTVWGWEHGIAFSARPVKVNEKMCLRIVGTPQSETGMFFGFTSHDPATHTHTLPEYVIDIIGQPGIWAEGTTRPSEVLLHQFDYYVNSAGDVHFSINGEDKGLFLTGVDTKNPLWALVYLSKDTAVKFVDLRAPNQVRRPNQSPVDDDKLKAPRTTGTGGTPDNLPPLTFHSVHGENVKVFNDGTFSAVEASRDGIAFSARPVKVNEKVCLRFVGTLELFNAIDFSFGFTNHDPATFARPLLLRCFTNRDFINKPGNWVKSQRLFTDNIFDYYVNSAGDVHFSINGEDRGLFLFGVDTNKPLWALVLLDYGAIVQLLDPRTRAPNQVRRQNQSPVDEDEDRFKAPRTTGTGGTPDILPPLTFHSVHGENIRVFSNGKSFIVRRVREDECGNGIAFSARPFKLNEKVCFHFLGTPFLINTGFYFGFTSYDPATLAHSLRINSFDFITKPGNWTYIAYCKKDFIFDYYVNSAGDVYFSINGEDERLLFTGVHTKNPLWAFVEVRDQAQAVQFVAPRAPNQVRRQTQSPVDEDRLEASLSSLCVNEPLPPPRYAIPLVPLNLHRTKGRNVRFVNHRRVVARVDAEISQGYVFTAQPMRPGQTIVVQVLSTESAYDGSLSVGLTSCDPAILRPCDLPADAELLLDRPEYWVVQRDAANGLGRGDELAVSLTMDGEVTVSRNGSTPVTFMHVDHTVRLWAFFDICGKVRMLTTKAVTSPPQQLRVLTGTAAPLAGAGGTVLVDSSPPHNNAQNASNRQQGLTLASAHYIEPIQASSQPCLAGQQQQPAEGNSTETECTICFDNPIDSALYACGHMCMCYTCAVQQWKGKGSGQCPQCRAEIIDVIRIYKP